MLTVVSGVAVRSPGKIYTTFCTRTICVLTPHGRPRYPRVLLPQKLAAAVDLNGMLLPPENQCCYCGDLIAPPYGSDDSTDAFDAESSFSQEFEPMGELMHVDALSSSSYQLRGTWLKHRPSENFDLSLCDRCQSRLSDKIGAVITLFGLPFQVDAITC